MALSREGQSHDVQLSLPYWRADAPREAEVESKFGTFKDVVELRMDSIRRGGGGKQAVLYSKHPMTIVDGRTSLPGGKAAWSFEEHGFQYLTTPEYDFEDHTSQNRRRVNEVFGPKVAEAVRAATGATRAFWMSHQRRAEKAVATATEGYATGAGHSDYGPEFEAQFRQVLEHRYKVPAAEAQSCGLCVANFWCPVERPAYLNPLALLDGSSVDMEKEVLRWKSHSSVDNGYGYYNGFDNSKSLTGVSYEKGKAPPALRPLEERVPQAAQDAPALAPTYAPQHRWVYLPDMLPSEGVVFKQIDFRKGAKAKATFHCSFEDRFHADWKDCPGRRSIECRVILTYDDPAAAPSAKL